MNNKFLPYSIKDRVINLSNLHTITLNHDKTSLLVTFEWSDAFRIPTDEEVLKDFYKLGDNRHFVLLNSLNGDIIIKKENIMALIPALEELPRVLTNIKIQDDLVTIEDSLSNVLKKIEYSSLT